MEWWIERKIRIRLARAHIYRQTGWETPLSKPLFEPTITSASRRVGLESKRQQNPKLLYTPQILVIVCRVAWKRRVLLAEAKERMGDCTTHGITWVSPHEGQPKSGERMFGRVRVRAAPSTGESMHESRHLGTLEPTSRTDASWSDAVDSIGLRSASLSWCWR